MQLRKRMPSHRIDRPEQMVRPDWRASNQHVGDEDLATFSRVPPSHRVPIPRGGRGSSSFSFRLG